MIADAIATVVNVLGWPPAEPLVADVSDVAVLMVGADGTATYGGGGSRARRGTPTSS